MASKHKAGSTATDIYSVTQMKHANVLKKNSHTEQQWKKTHNNWSVLPFLHLTPPPLFPIKLKKGWMHIPTKKVEMLYL